MRKLHEAHRTWEHDCGRTEKVRIAEESLMSEFVGLNEVGQSFKFLLEIVGPVTNLVRN